jgi:hypothetical protein
MFVRPGSLAVRIAIAHVVLAGANAYGDPPADGSATDGGSDVTADELALRDSSLFHDPGEPLLKLDLVPRPNVVGLGVAEDTQRTAFRLGKRATINATATSWKGYTDAVPLDGAESAVARGQRAAIGFSYDFGWLQLDASLSDNSLSSRYGSGQYRDVSLTLSKSHQFSRWVRGWIGLTIGHREWVGIPPAGESNSSFLMLSIGGTFR